MANIRDFRRVHMVGVGGSSMSGLASLLKDEGFLVTGSDRTRSHKIERLEKLVFPCARDSLSPVWEPILVGSQLMTGRSSPSSSQDSASLPISSSPSPLKEYQSTVKGVGNIRFPTLRTGPGSGSPWRAAAPRG